MKPDATTALAVVEHLRYGLPPPGKGRAFTVGRQEQLQALERRWECPAGSSLLLQADYGAGKSHILQVLRETALAAGFAASLVVVNSQEGVRFDRLEAIFGAVCRQLEVDGLASRGIAALFGSIERFPPALSSNGRWDYSEYLASPAMYVALRAWLFGDAATRLLVEDWLTNPAAYRERRRHLYDALVYGLRDRFRDPRPEWKFHAQELLVFQRSEPSQVWPALVDLARIARAAGRRGLVLLFDEMEDIVQNLPRLAQRQDAVDNLLRFFHPSSDQAPNRAAQRDTPPLHAVFAVTVDFIEQCRPSLPPVSAAPDSTLRLPVLTLEPLPQGALVELAGKIRQAHALAYGWDAAAAVPDADLARLVAQCAAGVVAQRVRRCIQGVLQALDERLAGGGP